MRRSSVEEYTETMRQHYTGACRTEKSRLLDEFTRRTGSLNIYRVLTLY